MNSMFWNTLLLAVCLLFSGYNTVYAECVCSCVNGKVEAICQSSVDVQPVCPPRICPITPPAVSPINPPTMPPVGMSSCNMKQVYNNNTRNYEWQQVCQ